MSFRLMAARTAALLVSPRLFGLLLVVGVGIGDAAAAGRYSNRGPWSNDRAAPPPAASAAPAPCETGGLTTRRSARRGGACDEPLWRRRRIK